MMNCLVTGGCGFVGSHLVDHLIRNGHRVLNLDALTYAADKDHLKACKNHPAYELIPCNLATCDLLPDYLDRFQPDLVFHLAAETHVDRSIADPGVFLQSNTVATFRLLEALSRHLARRRAARESFRLIHVSTDEVYGQLAATGAFLEDSPYRPRSPYSASKAAADHFVQAWQATYGLPAIITRSTNNFGPRQHPEKLIPKIILHALAGRTIPIYGDGSHRREWLFVGDHVRALLAISRQGKPGESYNISSSEECANLELAHRICMRLDEISPRPDGTSYTGLIRLVDDRPGHDFRYAMDTGKIRKEIGWKPEHNLETALSLTIDHFQNSLL